MFEKLQFSMNRVYPALVVSTMSSGKSTLINALAGKELLPSRNRACTAKAIAIMDNDRKPEFEIHAVNSNGEYNLIKDANKKKVAQFNDTNEVSEMILEGQIRGIKTRKKALLLVDTPGINNSMDQNHETITKEVLDKYNEGLILYVINAQQIGTYDDNNFLTYVSKKLKDNPKFSIIFVVNKMDLIDPEKEKPDVLIANCKEYIENKGIDEPILIPVSASSALIFKKVLNGEPLSELEEENFTRNFRYFKRGGYSLVDYSSVTRNGDMQEVITVEGNKYTRAEIMAALYNTGLTMLESIIDETLVYSLKMNAPRIHYKSNANISKNTQQATSKSRTQNKNTQKRNPKKKRSRR